MNSLYGSKLTDNWIWQDFIVHFKSETTKSSYQTDINEIMNYIQKDFLKINQEDVAAYFRWMQGRVEDGIIQPGTMAKKFRELHSFAEYICENREKYRIGKEFQDWYYIYLKQVTKQEKYARFIYRQLQNFHLLSSKYFFVHRPLFVELSQLLGEKK